MKRKKTLLFCGSVAVIMLVAGLWFVGRQTQASSPAVEKDTDVLFTVNGTPIEERIFTLFLNDERAATAQYFYTTYGVEMNDTFWTSSFGGENPTEYCETQARAAVVAYCSERQLAVERSLEESADFGDLMADMETLNLENEARVKNGEVVYGLQNFSLWQYLLYAQSNLDIALLKDEIERNRSTVPEETLRTRYEADKETYRAEPSITYERLELPQDTPSEILEQLSAAVQEGETLAAAASRVLGDGDYTVTEAVSTQETIGKDDMWAQELQDQIVALMPGQITAPIYLADSVCIARCIQREEQGYLSFEEAREDVLYLLSQETLKTTIDQRSEEAAVVLIGE